MKLILVILMFALYHSSRGQAITPITYTEVVYIDSTLKKDELYNRARLWFAQSFNDSKAVLEIQDKEAGQLVGKGKITYIGSGGLIGTCLDGYISYTVSLYLKNGRYKYEFTDFIHEGGYGTSMNCSGFNWNMGLITTETAPDFNRSGKNKFQINWEAAKTDISNYIQDLLSSLKPAMKKPSIKSDDW